METHSLPQQYEKQLADLEQLLDSADPTRRSDSARIEATLVRLLERLASRRRPFPVRSDRERIDTRATLCEYLRKGEYLTGLIYRERPKQKKLVVLIDLSESFRMFMLWSAVVAVTAKRVAPGVSIWGFGPGLWPLEAECADVGTFIAAAHCLPGRARYSLADLPALLDEIARQTTGAARLEVWAISDLLLAPGQSFDISPAAIDRARHALRSFIRLRVLDPTNIYQRYEDDKGYVNITGKQLRELIEQEAAWRVAETQRTVILDIRSTGHLADMYSDKPMLQTRRVTPWLNTLRADPELAPRIDLIIRQSDRSCLAELFFGGQL